MIAVDTSALIAILENEPESAMLLHGLLASPAKCISAVTLLEARMVSSRRRPVSILPDLISLMTSADIKTVTFDPAQSDIASTAFQSFGKGSGHPARLNFGDCAAYALASSRDIPLLFVGDDFSQTGIRSALAP